MSNQPRLTINRRTVLRSLLAAGAFGLTSRLGTGCTPSSDTGSGSADDITIGFIYVGAKDDYGYNQSHAKGRDEVAALDWVKTIEQANVSETTAVAEAMRSMISQDGARVIFPTSYGYFDPHSLQIAKEFPEVQLFHPNQPYKNTYPKNVGSYFINLVEPAYLAGIVAAYATKTNKLGFVVPKAIPVVLQEVNSFALGARSIKPNIQVQTIFTGDWFLPNKEAEATNSLVDQNADVITSRVDNLKVVITTAEKRGVYSCGYHIDQAELAPKGYLTGVEWNWGKIYGMYAQMLREGKTLMNGGIPAVIAGGLKEDFCRLSAYGSAVGEAAKQAADAAKAKLLDGSLVIFKGEMKDNKGQIVIPAGQSYKLTDPQLQAMNWLVEGVLGDTGAR